MTASQELITNRIFAALPAEEFERLVPWLEPVSLRAGEVVTPAGKRARHVYFP
jgi:hypothetical protein